MGLCDGLSYQSVRFIKVQNRNLALLHYAIMGIVLMYVIVFSIVIKQGYQEFKPLVGSTSLKVKGAAMAKGVVYDSIDLILPPIEKDALFVSTSYIHTFQHRGVCPSQKTLCTDGCVQNESTYYGFLTGKCGSDNVHCQINAWCPLEVDDNDNHSKSTLYEGVEDWGVFVKVNVRYPEWDVTTDNLPDPNKLTNGINLFKVKDLLSMADADYETVKWDGAILAAQWVYNCDLNKAVRECEPKVQVSRLDDPKSAVSAGSNYRYSDIQVDSTTGEQVSRSMFKLKGIRFVFSVTGEGGRFSIVPLLVTFGAGMALLSVSTVVCDLVMTYCLRNKHVYVDEKFEVVDNHGPVHQDLKNLNSDEDEVEHGSNYQVL